MPEATPLPVGIAVVLQGDQVLVGWRGPDGPLAGFAEFPGGKCEPGESPAECAVRECREETGLEVEIVGLLAETVWQYPHATVRLSFFHCRPVETADVASTYLGFRWLPLATIPALPFPEANRDLIRQLQHGRTADPAAAVRPG